MIDDLTRIVDLTTIYTAESSGNEAVDWLLDDQDGNSDCDDPFFIQRYALSIIFASSLGDWTQLYDGSQQYLRGQCEWAEVNCFEESVAGLYTPGSGSETKCKSVLRCVIIVYNVYTF